MRLPALLSSLALAALFPSCNIVPSVRVTPRLGTLELDGDLVVNDGGVTVTAEADELGFDDDSGVFQPRVDVAWGPVDIVVSGHQTAFEGEGSAQVEVGPFTGSDSVTSSLDLTSVGVLLTWDFVPTDLVDLGVGFGVRYFDIEATVTPAMFGTETRIDESSPIPVVAARAAVQVFDLELSGVASGVSFGSGDADATYLDVDLMASWTFERFLGFHGALVAGWRQILLDVEYEDDGADDALDFTLSGPFIGLTLGI